MDHHSEQKIDVQVNLNFLDLDTVTVL